MNRYFKWAIAPVFAVTVLWLTTGAVGNIKVSQFPSISVQKTNYSAEVVITNGVSLGGSRITAWPVAAPTSRLINTTAPLTGGGDLTADRTIAMAAATDSVPGYLTAADHSAFKNGYLAITGGILQGGLAFTGASSTLTLPVLTTIQRNALTAASGFTIFDSTLKQIMVYDGTQWQAVSGGSGTTIIYDTQIVTNLTVNDSLTINTNITVNNNITVKGNGSVNVLSVGSATITNSTSRVLTTSWSPISAGTNYAADLSLPVMQWNMTSALNVLHATNGTANFPANFQKEAQFKIINGSGGNLTVTLPSAWKPYGSATTNSFIATNGTSFILAIQFAGTTTSQTNVDYALVYRSY